MATLANSSGKQKKNPNKNTSKDPLKHQIRFYNKEKGVRLPYVGFKTELVVEAALDRSEPSPRFAFNGIHTKSEADNLQGNGLEKGIDASQVQSKEEVKNPGLSNSRTPSWR